MRNTLLITILFMTCTMASTEEVKNTLTPPALFSYLIFLLFLTIVLGFFYVINEKRSRKREYEQLLAENEELKQQLQQAYSELSTNEERSEYVHPLIGLGFWQLNMKTGEISLASDVKRFLQIPPEESITRITDMHRFIPTEHFEKLQICIEISIKEKRTGEYTFVIKDQVNNHTIHAKQSWINLYTDTGEYQKTLGVSQDISEQHAIEKEQRQTRMQLRSIIDSIHAPIYLKNRAGYFQLVNKAFEELATVPEAQIINKSAHDIFPPEKAKKNTQRDSIVLNTGVTTTFEEGHRLNNVLHYFNTTKIPLKDEKGLIYGLVAMSIDNTEQKRMENALIKARDEAERAYRSKSEFLANMSHEIRTPLNAVTGFSELLQDTVANEQQKRYLTAIKTAGKTLLALINDILDLSKLEAGKLELNIIPTSIPALFNEMEQLFHMKATEKGLRLTFFSSNSFPSFIEADGDRLKQILINLIGNSLKFTERGEITVAAEALTDEGKMTIVVKDTGIGIETQAIESIFNDFEQQSGQDNRKFGGTGLGLSICKRLIALMGGEIFVASKRGAGAAFTIELPLIESKHVPITQIPFDDNTPGISFKGELIWIAEDSDSNRILLEEALKLVNLRTESFNSGSDLIHALGERKPDIILTDFQMPGMNGLELLKLCRQHEKCATTPIIVLTTLDNLEEYHYFTGKGFDHCLQKPVEIEKLYTLLSDYLRGDQPREKDDKTKESDKISEVSLSFLREQFLPKVQSLQGAINVEKIKELTKELEEVTMGENCSQLSEFIHHIYNAVQSFDVISIRAIPVKTEALIQSLEGEEL